MTPTLLAATATLLVACATPPIATPTAVAPPRKEVALEEHTSVAGPAAPQALYATCRGRVEEPEVADECEADADCGRTGCGGEVCTTAAQVGEVTTTCERRPCFAVLDTCGCHERRCTWTVRPEVAVTPH